MAITIDDFAKVWASQSPLTPYEFSESNYKEGWNFIGGTPPSRQMWDFIQKQNDEKSKYLFDNIQALASILVPVGCVQAYAGNTLPNGWLLCDGSAINRVDYADLFVAIGTAYGSGDGNTTFNLPNLIDKFVEGSATSGSEKSAGLPNINTTGSGSDNIMAVKQMNGSETWNGPLGVGGSYANSVGSGGSAIAAMYLQFDASRSNSIYGNSNTVQPPALTMRYIIKY